MAVPVPRAFVAGVFVTFVIKLQRFRCKHLFQPIADFCDTLFRIHTGKSANNYPKLPDKVMINFA